MYQQEFLEKNLAALSARNPELSERIRAAKEPPSLTVSLSKSGLPTARVADGEFALHSNYDPAKEAARFADAQHIGQKDDYVLLGFALGYVAEEIASRLEAHQHLLVVEADPGILRAALSLRDMTKFLASPSVLLYSCEKPERFALEVAAFFDSFFRQDIAYVFYPPSLRLHGALYEQAAEEMRNAANKRTVDLQTAIALGPICQANIVRNSVAYLSIPGIEEAKKAFAGRPAIIAAAGPSLDKNIGLLPEARKSALLISVGTVFKKLLAAGARPHLVVSMDPSEISYKYFENLPPLEDVVLAADPEVYPPILADYPGPRAIIDIDAPIIGSLRRFSGPKGKLEKGRTVAHTAYYLAEFLGANPIIFVGLDLSFPGGKAHAEGCSGAWGSDLNVETEAGIVMVRGIDGKMLPTRRNFLNFLTIFENDFARTKTRIIDATEGGAIKRGTEIMTLRAALDKCAREKFDAAALLRERLGKAPGADFAAYARWVDDVILSLARIRTASEEGLETLERIERLLKDSAHDSAPVKKLKNVANEYNARILAEQPAVAFVQRTMMNTKIFFESREVLQIDRMPPGLDKVKSEMRRTAVYFEDTRVSAKRLLELFRELKSKLAGTPAEIGR